MALKVTGPKTRDRYVPPEINGHRYSYASIELIVNGLIVVGVGKITYGSSLEPGIVYGSDSHKIGRTPGQVSHHCDLEMYRREWSAVLETLGQSFGRTSFDVIVQYAEEGDEGVTTDSILGCRVKELELDNQLGPEPASVRLALDPMDIRYGKQELSIDLLNLGEVRADTTAGDTGAPLGVDGGLVA